MKKVILALLLTATVAQAEMYTWSDTEGTVHFSESLAEVPAGYRNSAKALGMESSGATHDKTSVPAAESRQRATGRESATPNVEEMKERMMKDEGTMALIRELQNDPGMQTLLRDPAVLRAIQAGDIGTLTSNPDFMKLLNNPRVREIVKGMQNSGTK
ncbi:MAG: DUF4124 domain-containing protein [Desulfobacteraceae bacterium]|nr:DUF4124 domain-containing protein [Desulfobacteraceae bacterium]